MTARRLILCTLILCAYAPTAQAAGPPLPSSASGSEGAIAPGGTERLVTRRAGADTLVSAVRTSDTKVLRSRTIAGRWSVPPVTINGGTTGLSADGRTLVLARPERNFPPADTALAVIDTSDLHVQREIRLPGFFTVDAISPDGRWVYLIQYRGDDVLDYRVRALDTRTGRLDPRNVVDPREPEEQMGGLPMTRVVSSDGRWAYTLYGGGDETFIHALDTVGRTAACIDLEMLPSQSDLSNVQLELHGGRLEVSDGAETVAIVDRRTFAVTEPGAEPAAPAPVTDPDDGFPWAALLILGGAATFVGVVVVAGRHFATPQKT
jgi:hypothetical protein